MNDEITQTEIQCIGSLTAIGLCGTSIAVMVIPTDRTSYVLQASLSLQTTVRWGRSSAGRLGISPIVTPPVKMGPITIAFTAGAITATLASSRFVAMPISVFCFRDWAFFRLIRTQLRSTHMIRPTRLTVICRQSSALTASSTAPFPPHMVVFALVYR